MYYLYLTILTKISLYLFKKIIKGYTANNWLAKLLRQLDNNKDLAANKTLLSFIKKVPLVSDPDL